MNNRKILSIKIITFFAWTITLPSIAFGMDSEFYTYGGFTPIVTALQKIALIFGSGDYVGLFFVAAVLGIFTGGIMMYSKAIMGAKATHMSWAFTVGIGVAVYLALIVPKGTLHVYDTVKNRYQAVGGIPDGIVLIAGTLNMIERGLVDIVSSTADPVSVQNNGNGAGFDLLYNITSKGVLLSDQYLNVSLNNYVKDCVFFEMQRPGTTLSINSLSNNMDFTTLFVDAANPAIYTTFYSDLIPNGNPVTCDVAWASINAAVTNIVSYNQSIHSRCADAGFDPTSPLELNQCQTLLSSTAT